MFEAISKMIVFVLLFWALSGTQPREGAVLAELRYCIVIVWFLASWGMYTLLVR